jgi:hypothetical protein
MACAARSGDWDPEGAPCALPFQIAVAARVVEQDIDAPAEVDRFLNHRLNIFFLRDVAVDAEHPAVAGRVQARGFAFEVLVVEVSEDDLLGPVAEQRLGEGQADARRAACDDRDLVPVVFGMLSVVDPRNSLAWRSLTVRLVGR